MKDRAEALCVERIGNVKGCKKISQKEVQGMIWVRDQENLYQRNESAAEEERQIQELFRAL